MKPPINHPPYTCAHADGSSGPEYLGDDCDLIDDRSIDEDADMHRIYLRQSSMLEDTIIEAPPAPMEESQSPYTTILKTTLPKDNR